MLKDALQTEQINTDADASLKGLGLQKVRAVERLLSALKEGKKAVFCTIEHIDDVLEVDISEEKTEYTTEQNKSYSTSFSMNSQEIKNSLRIFFDNWFGIVESSESIQFVFYTNTSIANENKIGVLKDIEDELPAEPLIQLLIEKKYELALPFVLPILRQYYIEQHGKHTKDIRTYEQLWDSMTLEKWGEFFDLIEWNFGEKNELEVRASVDLEVRDLCIDYGVELKFVNSIVSQLIDMVESRTFKKDFLQRIVHVAEVKSMFLELAQNVKIVEKLDPIHLKWDDIKCDDIRDINDKILNVCPDYDTNLLVDLEQEYIDGLLEQKSCPDIREIKAYNYRVYVVCKKIVKQVIKDRKCIFSQDEISGILDRLTDEAEKLITDKAKTYKMPFLDRDMVRKTIIFLFQECYLALDERSVINE
jgi:hypothetical protein